MAQYILEIFKHYLGIVLCWGFNTPIALEDGLQFNVEGFLFKGKVRVRYNEGADTFFVQLINADGSIKRQEEDIYLDNLVDVIDGMVERCENYRQKVVNTYYQN